MSRMLRSVVLLLVAAMALGASGQAMAQTGTGTVRVLNYFCSYLDSTLLVEAIDQTACAPGAGTFSFYLYGDGTDAHETLTVDASGAGSIDLAVGTYDMVAEATQTHFDVTVAAGVTTQLLIGNPSGGGTETPVPPVGTGTVTIQRFQCSYVDSTLLAEAIDQAACTPLASTFTFYLYGDGTANYYEASTGNDGMGTVTLPVGSYQMVDEFSQTHFDLNVMAGENVVMLVIGPQSVAPTPQPTTPAAPSTQTPAATSTQPAAATKLPNTGSGSSGHAGTAMIAVAGTVAAAMAGVAIVRRTREDAI